MKRWFSVSFNMQKSTEVYFYECGVCDRVAGLCVARIECHAWDVHRIYVENSVGVGFIFTTQRHKDSASVKFYGKMLLRICHIYPIRSALYVIDSHILIQRVAADLLRYHIKFNAEKSCYTIGFDNLAPSVRSVVYRSLVIWTFIKLEYCDRSNTTKNLPSLLPYLRESLVCIQLICLRQCSLLCVIS